MDKEKLIMQVKELHLDTNNDVLEQIISDWDEFSKAMDIFKKIDVSNVIPMTRVDNTPINSLREDIEKISFSKKDFLNNSPENDGDYIVIEKVVGNE